MRIVGGKNRGRKLAFPDQAYTRPTTDRIREAIFNILCHHPEIDLQGAYVLDAFAGSGAVGLEALSRGAANVTFVEAHPKVVNILQQNLKLFSESDQIQLMISDIRKLKKAARAMDLVFLDPPYGKGLEFQALPYLVEQNWINSDTVIVYETEAQTDIVPLLARTAVLDDRRYGGTKVYLLKLKNKDEEANNKCD